MHGKNFPFHLTAHSNALAASSWVLELILPQIYLVPFRSPPQQVSTLRSSIHCFFSSSRAVPRNDDIEGKRITLGNTHNLCNCFVYSYFCMSRNSQGLACLCHPFSRKHIYIKYKALFPMSHAVGLIVLLSLILEKVFFFQQYELKNRNYKYSSNNNVRREHFKGNELHDLHSDLLSHLMFLPQTDQMMCFSLVAIYYFQDRIF